MQLNYQLLQPFETIIQESSLIHTDNHIPQITTDSNSQSFQLLLRAYERIRTLQQENEQLYREINKQQDRNKDINTMCSQIQRLKQALREKDIKIQNLQKITQKSIIDYIKIERELYHQRKDICRIRKNLSVLPAQVSSPLDPTIANKQDSTFDFILPLAPNKPKGKECIERTARKDRVFPNFRDKDIENISFGEFTFDVEKWYPGDSKKVLKNCFSTNEMTSLVNKVHFGNSKALNDQKNKLKEYKNYCSSIQKKYSPGVSLKKDKKQPVKQLSFSTKFCNSPKYYQLRPVTSINEKHYSSTVASTTKSAGFFKNINERL